MDDQHPLVGSQALGSESAAAAGLSFDAAAAAVANDSGESGQLSDIAAKWMAAVSTADSDEDIMMPSNGMEGAGEEEENIFAVDIVPPGLEHVVEEEEEEEEEEDDDEQVESPGHAQRLGQGLGAALLALRPNRDTGTEQAEEEEEEEEATSPWDRYIAASDETQPESTPGGDEADAKVLRT